jgi:hypothetical protein
MSKLCDAASTHKKLSLYYYYYYYYYYLLINLYNLNLIARKYKINISSTKKMNGNVQEPHAESKNCDK